MNRFNLYKCTRKNKIYNMVYVRELCSGKMMKTRLKKSKKQKEFSQLAATSSVPF